jgi:transposase InsO family protein
MNGQGEHRKFLQEIIQVCSANQDPSRRGRVAQEPRRLLECHVRESAVGHYRRLSAQGWTLEETARSLELCPRTLRQWDYDCRPRGTPTAVKLLGRPAQHATSAQRERVRAWLVGVDGAAGLPRLCREFPTLARAELDDVLQSHRHELRQQAYRSVRVLHWQVPGRVWAIDFAEPSLLGASWSLPPIDGRYPYLLAVRDLASGYQLAWRAVADASAAATQALLRELFAQHGMPLVLKMDNGAPFRAQTTQAFLVEAGVISLFSPPGCPGYNGSIEAAIGSFKRRTEAWALDHGHPGIWTSADLEAALRLANTCHPLRLNGRTPEWVYASRSAIATGERFGFALAVEDQRARARVELLWS